MADRVLIAFPTEDSPGLRAEAAQLALGLAECDHQVFALGTLGPWRHALRRKKIAATEFSFTGDQRKLSQIVQDFEPQIIHTFGAATAHLLFPLAQLSGAGTAATLTHADISNVNPAEFQQTSVVFTPCEQLRDQFARRLSAPVFCTGFLLPKATKVAAKDSIFLAEKLGLQEGSPVVLMADSFSGEETEVALKLIDATSTMARRIKGVQILIAGDGGRLMEMESRAAAVNDKLGYRAVLLPGFRDDIGKLLALATVAVGSGRFAMEAVGAGVALVAAGAAGMIGTYTEETASVAHFTCCGRHGRLEPVTSKLLAAEIVGLFTYDKHRKHFASYGQEAVMARFERSACAVKISAYYSDAAASTAIIKSPQRVTVILPDDLRELLFALPAVSGLHANYPLAQITLITIPEHGKFLAQLGLPEKIITKPSTARSWLSFLQKQRPRADICLCFSEDFFSALLAAFSFAPHRFGFKEGAGSLFFSDQSQWSAPVSTARALTLLNAIGVFRGADVAFPNIPPEIKETVNRRLFEAGVEASDPLIILSPEAEKHLCWEADRWCELATLLLESRPEKIAVIGQQNESWPEGVITVIPVQDSLMLAALLARADLVVAADGPQLHLTGLIGKPAVGLYGPTSPAICSLNKQQERSLCTDRGMTAITPEEVAAAIAAVLSKEEASCPV